MAEFKIFGIKEGKENKAVLLKGVISDYKNYRDLRQKIIDASKNSKLVQQKIKDKDVFILAFSNEKEKKKGEIYIPSDLKEGIWDNKTFSYLKEKISLRQIKGTYRFMIKKVERLPKWRRKEFHELLNEALDVSWKPINEEIVSGISLRKLEEGNVNYKKMKDELKKNEEILNQEVHKNIICNKCFKNNLKGKRFVCAECNNYNLCQECEKLCYQNQIHTREHILIQVNKPLNDEDEDNIYKYGNIIGNNNQEFKNVPSSFQLEISVINSGENDLKDCYILPVRYGEDYLSCNPKVIKEEVQRNMTVKIILVIRVPNDKGYFEGYFRMFTPHGLPFGKVLYVKVLNGD